MDEAGHLVKVTAFVETGIWEFFSSCYLWAKGAMIINSRSFIHSFIYSLIHSSILPSGILWTVMAMMSNMILRQLAMIFWFGGGGGKSNLSASAASRPDREASRPDAAAVTPSHSLLELIAAKSTVTECKDDVGWVDEIKENWEFQKTISCFVGYLYVNGHGCDCWHVDLCLCLWSEVIDLAYDTLSAIVGYFRQLYLCTTYGISLYSIAFLCWLCEAIT